MEKVNLPPPGRTPQKQGFDNASSRETDGKHKPLIRPFYLLGGLALEGWDP